MTRHLITERAAVHQRRQAPGQPGRVACCPPTSTPATSACRARRCCSSAPPTSTAPRPSWPPRRRASRWPSTAVIQHEVQQDVGERFGLSWDHFGRSSSPAEPRAHEPLRRASRRPRASSRSAPPSRCTRRSTGASCPIATSSAPARTAATRTRGATSARTAPGCSIPPTCIDPRSAISGSTDLEVRETKHVFLLQSKLADEVRDVGRGPRRRVAEPHAVDRPQVARRGPRATGASPATSTGACRWSTVPASRSKVWYVWFDAPIEYLGATAEWAEPTTPSRDWRSWWYDGATTSSTRSSWPRTTCRSTRCRFPVTLIGSREPWKLVDQIKGFNWLTYYGGKFSTSQGRGVFMDQALDTVPRRLLALVPVRQRARVRATPASPGTGSPSRSTRTWPTRSATSSTVASRCRPSSYGAVVPAGRRGRATARSSSPPTSARSCAPTRSCWRPRSCGSRPTSCGAAGRWPTRTGSRASRGRSSRPTPMPPRSSSAR